ncbi:hypothetical protein VTI74DRAFT_2834 [Chaetomium olivicolor]
MPPRCRRCDKGETLDKALFKCIRCSRYYHSACHRPHPRQPISNWVCKRCLADRSQLKRRHYHDKSLLSSRAASPSSALSGVDIFARASMAPSATNGSATSPTSSIRTQQNGLAGPIINCSFPGCSAKIDAERQVLCEAHLQNISRADRNRDAVKANRTHAVPHSKGTPSASRGPVAVANHKKLLPETDKDRPIMRRKTAGNPPQFMPQQPTPKNSTPSSRGEPTRSPPPPRAIAPRPPVHSPPASPSQDGEPARKRQRLSPSPERSSKTGAKGPMASTPSSSEPNVENRPVDPKNPQYGRRPSNQSPRQTAKVRDREGKAGFKPGFKHSVRRVPLALSSLRFIDNPEDAPPSTLAEKSSSGVNGSAEGTSRQRDGESAESLEYLLSYWGAARDGDPMWSHRTPDRPPRRDQRKRDSNATRGGFYQETTQDSDSGLEDDTGRTLHWPPSGRRRDSERTSGQSQKSTSSQPGRMPRPKEPEVTNGESRSELSSGTRKPDRAPPCGPLQADGSPISKKPPHTVHFPIRPGHVTKTKPLQLPRKEIDTARFDALIYSQPGAASPPPDVLPALAAATTATPLKPSTTPPKELPPKDEPFYLPIDPRIHWPQPHSDEWHSAKQEEIRSRGRRKANFGRATQSLRRESQIRLQRQRQQQQREGRFEDSLPEKIAENPAWVRVLRRLKGLPPPVEEEERGGCANGVDEGQVGSGKRGKKPQQQQGGVMGRKIGGGMVMFTGLNGVELGRRRLWPEET